MGAMQVYERNDYEDWDEYEDDEADEVEEEGGDDGYEEDHQSTQEALEYLSIRQKLKESIRKQMKKDAGTASSSSRDKTNASRKDNYGSFFGPSQPVIAQRVIQESRSLLENPDLAARIYKTKTSQQQKKSSVSAPASSKSQPNYRPTVTNGLKKKVEMLKNTRDYSFLLSDDAEVPTSSKGPPPRNVSAPKSDARSKDLTPRSRPVVNGRGREDSNYRDGRRPMPPSTQKPKVGLDRLTHSGKSSAEPRKQFGSSNGSGPGRPLGPKAVPARSSVPATAKATQPVAKNIISGARKPNPSSTQPVARKPTQSNMQSTGYRPSSSHSQPSVMRRPVHQQQTSKSKFVSKQALPSSKAQLRRSPPRHPPRAALRDERPKPNPKRPLRDEDYEDDPINEIRKMFGYNPNNFRDDGDDSDMEANFDDIMMEEKRSAKIARQEDEEQLRLIEEEEKRERMRVAKRRKMAH